MHVQINREALDLVFRTLLSCQCSIDEDQQRKVFQLLQASPPGGTIDYARVLEIFKPNENTVFHRLFDFAIWSAPVDHQQYAITRDHTIRHFTSTFHWNQVVAAGMNTAYKNVLDVPSWFLGHTLLPVKVIDRNSETVSARYEFDGDAVLLQNLFVPREYSPRNGETWAVHFAALLGRFTPEEERTARLMIEMNPLLVQFRHGVKLIDYADFQRHGNYLALCKQRHADYYGGLCCHQ